MSGIRPRAALLATLALACVALAALLAPAVFAQTQDAPLSPAAERVFTYWKDRYEAARTVAAVHPAASPLEELDRRVGVEQAGRIALSEVLDAGLGRDDLDAVQQRIWSILGEADADNTAFLKSILPEQGWFRISVEGLAASQSAWLIAQHSPDEAFRAEALKRMTPLLESNDVERSQYALIFDRVQMNAGKPQRYGSQAMCVDHVLAFHDIEDRANVDARRAEMGLGPLKDYGERLGVGEPC
ncbi:MAG: DUF6624 domain-containing protein [Hyphomonadaceae bacterium]